MNDLREDLDRALRTVTFGEAPVKQAKRHGRRLRVRRRVTLLGAALAVAAVAAGYPALTRSGAAPEVPAAGRPAHSSPVRHDPVLTAGPGDGTTEAPGGLAGKHGLVASGKAGSLTWQVTVHGPGAGNPVPADPCYVVAFSPVASTKGTCTDLPSMLPGGSAGNGVPAAFTATGGNADEVTVGEVARNVAYFIVTFDDGQFLKLIPVTVNGHRYVAWVAPLSMVVKRVDAHLGGPYSTNGQVATAVPFDAPGLAPTFGLWQGPGLPAAPPRASAVIGRGTADGRPWSVTAYEGPWGTCFETIPSGGVPGANSNPCVPSEKLDMTEVIGGPGGVLALPDYGSAAPGVASLVITMSGGKSVRVTPVRVGNESLFALWVAKNAPVTGWTAYDASGRQVSAGAMMPLSVPSSAPAAP